MAKKYHVGRSTSAETFLRMDNVQNAFDHKAVTVGEHINGNVQKKRPRLI